MTDKKYLSMLNNEQLQAVESDSKEILLVAGAGTGKTNTIVKKIIYLIKEKNVKPDEILAVTFTNKAVREIRDRVNSALFTSYSGVIVNTFHQLSKNILDKDDNLHKLGFDNLKIIDDVGREKYLSNVIKKYDCYDILNRNDKDEKTLLMDINAKRNNRYVPSDKEEYEEVFEKIYNGYIFILDFNRYIDLDDMVNLAVKLLKEFPEERKEISSAFKYIFVDEYQDINKEQYQLISLLKNENNNILVVGDEDQAIYSWRGSNTKYFQDFKKQYENCEVIKLERNYRSTKEILDLSDKFIKQNKNRIDKTLRTELQGVKPEILCFNEIKEQIDYIFNFIINNDVNYNDIAILMRSRNYYYLDMLKTKLVKNDITYQMIGEFPLMKRKIIKELMYMLKFINNNTDNIALISVIKYLRIGLGDIFFKKIAEVSERNKIQSYYEIMLNCENYEVLNKYQEKVNVFLEMFKDYDITKSFLIIIEDVIINFFYDKTTSSEYHYLQEFLKNANRYYEKNGYLTLSEYLDYVQYYKSNENKNSVQIMTIHASKGLEYKYVFVVNLHAYYPRLFKTDYDKLSKDDLVSISQIEEERRLLYVAMTRAKEKLFLLGDKDCLFIQELINIQDS